MTDLKTNANKFYIMQIIDGGKGTYSLFIRYGRIGEPGRISYSENSDVEALVTKFKTQFKSKTKNVWDKRDNFTRVPGKYHLCEIAVNSSPPPNKSGEEEKTKVQCQLEDRVKLFIELISDLRMMSRTLKNLNVDLKKMPLGKISDDQLDRAFDILQEIKSQISSKNNKVDLDLVSEFYTLIPYSCGRRTPPIIDNDELINKFTEMIDELKNIELAQEIVKGCNQEGNVDEHPCDRIYKEISADIKPVDRDSRQWDLISTYLKNSHGATHTGCQVELMDIYEVNRNSGGGERARYDNFCQERGIEKKMLLWHGTRVSNFISILKMGLILRPDVLPGTYISGKMFGYGIYGANSFSKSLNYTGWEKGQEACLFLAEFAVGKQKKLMSHDYYVSQKSLQEEGFDSVWGRGENTITELVDFGADANGDHGSGVLIPQGKLVPATKDGDESGYGRDFNLIYDEFIVYNEAQLCLKYVVKVKCL
jgi:poly [ADP-ribose] polymerase